MPTPPSEADVLAFHEKLSNWGRWGPGDQLGTLNLITPDVRKRAAALVREGISVSCAQDLITVPQEGDIFGPVHRFMFMTGEGLGDEHRVQPPHPVPGVDMSRMAGAGEYIGMVFHGTNVTHVDALSHMFWDRKTYNGGPAELVNAMLGATNLAVTGMKDGIVTRGVLVDMPALRGVDWLGPGDGVFPEDLEAAEERYGGTRARLVGTWLQWRGCTSAAWQRSAATPPRTSCPPGTSRWRCRCTRSAWSRWACASSTTATSRSSRPPATGWADTSSCSPSRRCG